MTLMDWAGQVVSLVALGLCVLAFSSKDDRKLMSLLVSANIAFAIQFALFGSWASALLTLLVIVRIVLARRYARNYWVMSGVLAASCLGAWFTWQGPVDLLPLLAMFLGTLGMFLLRGVPMRLMLAAAATAWLLANLVVGSIGGVVAEAIVVFTNLITIFRLIRQS